MPVEFVGLLTVAVTLIAAVGIHAATLRLARIGFLAALLVSFMSGLSIVTIVHFVAPPMTALVGWDALSIYIGDMLIFICGWYIFLNFVVGNESSIRGRLLNEIIASGGAMPEKQLLADYQDLALVKFRFDRLSTSGYIKLVGNSYHLTSISLSLLVRLFGGLKRLILRKTSEFDTSELK